MKDIKYLWRHSPILSSPPDEIIKHKISEEKGEVLEKAIFLLSNGNYLYIMYNGMIDDSNTGVTDLEEFDSLEKAEGCYG